MTHETELIDVPKQHSIHKVLFGDSKQNFVYRVRTEQTRTHTTRPDALPRCIR